MAKKPNILVLMVDQLAPQALGCYGHKVVHSPNIDKLANNGLVFDSAYCNSPLCTPSRASFISRGNYALKLALMTMALSFHPRFQPLPIL